MSRQGLDRAARALFAEAGTSNGDRWRALAACLFAFSLPLAPMVLPLLLALAVATFIIDKDVWKYRPLLRIDPFAPATWSIVLLLLHLIGMLWTSNTSFGWFDIGIKLPLFLLPALAMLPGVRSQGRNAVLFSFCLGNVVAVLLCLALAAGRAWSPEGLGIQEFISSAFSATLHPSYFAWYLVMALACWYMGGLNDRFPRAIGAFFVMLLCAGVVLTGSRMGWITLPLVMVWSLASGWRDRWTRRSLLVLLLVSIGAGALLTAASEHVRYRVVEMFAPSDPTTADAFSSAAIRRVTWEAAWEVGKSNLPLGTGTGDVKDELLRQYESVGAQHALERKLNAHNQFLQTFAALGIPGVLVLLALFMFPMLRRIRALQACALVLVLLNFSVESMLEVQAGALFTGWLVWVLWWPTAPVASSRP
ncbi:MAG: O-antigen ligase family protein [Flavobacteriales bacterium]|nr:O-antigen ligase family protein [Flavobacteriales bacterium]